MMTEETPDGSEFEEVTQMSSLIASLILATVASLVATEPVAAIQPSNVDVKNLDRRSYWPVTLYDLQSAFFFIWNERKKYSVGENRRMELNEKGGIEIDIAEKKPDGVPEENWLPVGQEDEDLGVNLRIYVPDLEKMKTAKAPGAEMLGR